MIWIGVDCSIFYSALDRTGLHFPLFKVILQEDCPTKSHKMSFIFLYCFVLLHEKILYTLCFWTMTNKTDIEYWNVGPMSKIIGFILNIENIRNYWQWQIPIDFKQFSCKFLNVSFMYGEQLWWLIKGLF